MFNYYDDEMLKIFIIGGAVDIMSRRFLCASTKELALQTAKHIVSVDLPRDDA